MIHKRRLPINFNSDHANYFQNVLQIELPEPRIKKHHWVILLKNGIIFNIFGIKKQSLLYNTRLKDVGGGMYIFKVTVKELLFRRLKIIRRKAMPTAAVTNEWSSNYFHWITEVLPKVFNLKKRLKRFCVMLPSDYTKEFQIASLKLLNVPYINFDGIAFLNEVYLPDRQAPYSAHYNPLILKELSQEMKLATDLTVNFGPNIYITRRNAIIRKILNEEDVISILKSSGFAIVDFEDFTFDQQISISHHAKFVVSIHGAGLTNIVFCNPGTAIMEFSLENQSLDKCYFTLSDACDLNYYYQFCKSVNNSNDYHSSDLIVDLKLLNENLNLVRSHNRW